MCSQRNIKMHAQDPLQLGGACKLAASILAARLACRCPACHHVPSAGVIMARAAANLQLEYHMRIAVRQCPSRRRLLHACSQTSQVREAPW